MKLSEIVFCVLVLAVLALVGGMDFDDAKDAERAYCQDVRQGIYPDYKGIYDEVCK